MGKMFGSGMEQQIYHDNHAEFEAKVHSQYAKYLNELPFFVDYFHIIKVNSSADTGLLNIDQLNGQESPVRYNLIKDFPLFGLEQIQLELEDDDDVGLQTSYEGEAILLPNTITPMPDDYFIIQALGNKFMFRVTEIHYDTILRRNYYKINFIIRAVDNITYEQDFINQTYKTYKCIYDNYGTQDAFIIQEDEFNLTDSLQSLSEKLAKKYMTFFYNEKYNALMVKNPNGYNYIYDAYVNYFCNSQAIFAQRDRNLYNYKFYIEKRPEFEFLYNANSIFAAVLNQDSTLVLSPRFMKYYDLIPSFTDSIFQFYGDYDVKGITISNRNINPFGVQLFSALPEDLITAITREKGMELADTKLNIISRFIRKESVSEMINKLKDIPIRPTYSDYILIPILLYIIYQYRKSVISTTNNSYLDNVLEKQIFNNNLRNGGKR